MHQLPKIIYKHKRRVGRGTGSGHGKTAGRGQKGQKSREQVSLHIEGGLPLYRRLPKLKGFKPPRQKEYACLNLCQLDKIFVEPNSIVTPQILKERGAIKDLKDGLKILAAGKISKPMVVYAHKFSQAAVMKLMLAGGRAELIKSGG